MDLLKGFERSLDKFFLPAEDGDGSVREPNAVKQSKPNAAQADSSSLSVPASVKGSRESSSTRANGRLAERLAKATQPKPPSRVGTPANDGGNVRASVEVKRSIDISRSTPEVREPDKTDVEKNENMEDPVSNGLARSDEQVPSRSDTPSISARYSLESTRPSTDVAMEGASSRPSFETSSDQMSKSKAELLLDMEKMQAEHNEAETQRQEEMHTYLERIDALQAKLTYLAKETVAAAKEANASTGSSPLEKQLAEKDERIALLMGEGQKLSMNEMKHLQTIKKLRAAKSVDERASNDMRKKLERAERSEAELKARLRRVEAAERQAQEKVKQIAAIEKQVDELRVDRENAAELVRSLTAQLKEAKDSAVQAQNQAQIKAAEADKDRLAALQLDLEDAQLEKKLAEDRAAAELKKAKEKTDRQKERFSIEKSELKNEISALEAGLETMRARAEEASATTGSVEGESSVKLLRQVETLQQQYTLAKGNWETIEGSLNSRLAVLEKERDDATRRENDVRKKARDVGAKSRKAEDQLETLQDQLKTMEKDLMLQREQASALQAKLEQSEDVQKDTKAELDRQRKAWELDLDQRVEEEKLKWRRDMAVSPSRPEFPGRKSSGIETLNSFTRASRAGLGINGDQQRPGSRRTSTLHRNTPPEPSPTLSRRESEMSFDALNVPPTPSIEIGPHPIEDFETSSSPQRTINDLVSTSTAGPGPGPSVQLVERMSALVRKLESEKASFKDELGRLGAQRDEARNEIVALMREVEAKRDQEHKAAGLEKELKGLKGRYNASLEMLGEREEEVDELKHDVAELKRIYRELVETKVSGGAR